MNGKNSKAPFDPTPFTIFASSPFILAMFSNAACFDACVCESLLATFSATEISLSKSINLILSALLKLATKSALLVSMVVISVFKPDV